MPLLRAMRNEYIRNIFDILVPLCHHHLTLLEIYSYTASLLLLDAFPYRSTPNAIYGNIFGAAPDRRQYTSSWVPSRGKPGKPGKPDKLSNSAAAQQSEPPNLPTSCYCWVLARKKKCNRLSSASASRCRRRCASNR